MNLRLILGVTSAGLIAAGLVSGCGGDDTLVASTDGGADTGTDSSVPDGSGGQDAGIDSSPPVDGSIDAGTDAGPAPTPAAFLSSISSEVCTRVAACCLQIDGGAINNQECLNSVTGYGWQGSSTDVEALLAQADGGTIDNITIDAVGAQECLKAVGLLPCSVGSTLDQTTMTACYIDAVHGKLTTGQACQYAAECQQPAYCKYVDGGASGNCAPLEATGGNCSNVSGTSYTQALRGNEACSRRGTGVPVPPQFCDNIAGDGVTIKTPDQWLCASAKTNGSACLFNAACTSQICDSTTSLCADPLQIANLAECQSFE